MGLRYRRTFSSGPFKVRVTNRGVRVGARVGPVSVSEGRRGPYVAVRLARDLWDVLKQPKGR